MKKLISLYSHVGYIQPTEDHQGDGTSQLKSEYLRELRSLKGKKIAVENLLNSFITASKHKHAKELYDHIQKKIDYLKGKKAALDRRIKRKEDKILLLQEGGEV